MRQAKVDIVSPTAEQMGAAVFELADITDKRNGGGSITIGKAYRRKPMIEILRDTKVLNEDQYRALRHYRHHADSADRSPVRDSLCLQRGGNGDGPTIAKLHAARVRDDCERAAGTLADILRAVVVYDQSLSQWAMQREGAVERTRERRGRLFTCLEPKPKALHIARLEIRVAAWRVQSELDA